MGSTCEQGKPNGNQKTGGYRIGQKTIQKAKAHPAEGRSFGLTPLLLFKGERVVVDQADL